MRIEFSIGNCASESMILIWERRTPNRTEEVRRPSETLELRGNRGSLRDAGSAGLTDVRTAEATVVQVRWLPDVSWSKRPLSDTDSGAESGPAPVMVIRR